MTAKLTANLLECYNSFSYMEYDNDPCEKGHSSSFYPFYSRFTN